MGGYCLDCAHHEHLTLAVPEAKRKELREKFKKMMGALYEESQDTAAMRVEVLRKPEMLDFIDTHASLLDSTFADTKMSDRMRQDLQRSNWVFSGMKTFHELHEAFPSLLDEDGKRKPFEQFLKDVQRVDKSYNEYYLRAEYNFVMASAQAAADWEQYEAEGDRYHLQYRTASDERVREEHRALQGITLPPSDAFWDTHYPPNGWNCRCRVVQVRKSKHAATPPKEVQKRVAENERNQRNRKADMFRFNSGKQRKTVPDYNPYTIRKCTTCPVAQGKGKMNLAKVEPNEMCVGCALIRDCTDRAGCDIDPKYGERLLISRMADQTEIKANTRAAHTLLSIFPDMHIKIREHILENGHKNPEYLVKGKLADRKGIESENGVTNAFQKAIKQGCEAVVIDLDERMQGQPLRDRIIAKKLNYRIKDFQQGIIKECYIIYQGRATLIVAKDFDFDNGQERKAHIAQILQKIAEP